MNLSLESDLLSICQQIINILLSELLLEVTKVLYKEIFWICQKV